MTTMKIVRKISIAAVVIIIAPAFVYTAILGRAQTSNISVGRRGNERSQGEGLTGALR
jgi:hypothetical protein